MENELKLKANATKKDMIDQYKQLLASYKHKATQLEDAQKRLSETEKHKQAKALEVADEASVQSVIGTLGQLRGLIGQTLNDLTEKMSAQAETLENFKIARSLQEKRLEELHDVEDAADALKKLVAAYQERREEAETDFATRMNEQEKEYRDRKYATQKEMDELRAKWKEEREQTQKEREREEAEYAYQRDRDRKIEQDAYQESKSAREKDLAEREAAIAAREAELAENQKRVNGFPDQLQKEVEKASKETATALEKEMKQKETLTSVERNWEQKMYEQKIEHLESALAEQKVKVDELRGELGIAQRQVNEVAKKAIDGASLAKAYQSVNQIALEQARKPETRQAD